jgi:purine-binding chemotaxis protein CheW
MNEMSTLLVFSLDNRQYGMRLHDILKVLHAVEITPLPHVDEFILGVINVHGNITPVLNIRKLLGLNPKAVSLSDRLIMAKVASFTLIFVVDAVTEMRACPINDITSLECCVQELDVLKNNNDLIVIIDLLKILSENDVKILQKLVTNGSEAI